MSEPTIQILADTAWPDDVTGELVRITTFRLEFWRAILPQLLTHRAFSRSTASSRALMTSKVAPEPYYPQFSREQRGMGGPCDFSDEELAEIAEIYQRAYWDMTKYVAELTQLGVHRQHRNRLLEPFATVRMVLTATDWANFFALRCTEHVQPEMRRLAEGMLQQMNQAIPVISPVHVPYNRFSLNGANSEPLETAFDVSAARCARVSYKNDVSNSSASSDLALASRLLVDKHMSPFEHQAIALGVLGRVVRESKETRTSQCKKAYNLTGWASYRWLLDHQWNLEELVPVVRDEYELDCTFRG